MKEFAPLFETGAQILFSLNSRLGEVAEQSLFKLVLGRLTRGISVFAKRGRPEESGCPLLQYLIRTDMSSPSIAQLQSLRQNV